MKETVVVRAIGRLESLRRLGVDTSHLLSDFLRMAHHSESMAVATLTGPTGIEPSRSPEKDEQ